MVRPRSNLVRSCRILIQDLGGVSKRTGYFCVVLCTGDGACWDRGLIWKWVIVDVAEIHMRDGDTSKAHGIVEIHAIAEVDQTVSETAALVDRSSVLQSATTFRQIW